MNGLAYMFGGAFAVLLLVASAAAPAVAGNAAHRHLTQAERIAALNIEMDQAIQQVIAIVNQPVRRYPRGLGVKTMTAGWVPPGGGEPDFNTVDVRKTQQFPFAQYDYVTSNQNGLDMFAGADIEFNPMTAFFYEDRVTPKKRLTEGEMLKINALYRIVGKDKGDLAALGIGTAAPATDMSGSAARPNPFAAMLKKLVLVAVCVCALIGGALFLGKKKQA